MRNVPKNNLGLVSVFLLLTLALLAFTAEPISAQGNGADSVQHPLDGFDPVRKNEDGPGLAVGEDGSAIFPTVWCKNIDDEPTKTLCWKAYRDGLNYFEFGLSHRQKVLEWQHLSTKIILFVVLTLVGMGLYFAWVQFQRGETQNADNKIELSAEGLKISSPVLGVIILALSLGFFYLYLAHVYPITEII